MGSHGGPETPGRAAVRRDVVVAAPPDAVWRLVSDLPGMGRFSPENRGGRWVGGATVDPATGPAVGTVLLGSNGAGLRRWSTRSTVVRSEPGRAFAFDVRSLGLPVARWSYELEPVDGGCRLAESWEDRRGPLLRRLAPLLTGVGDRLAFTATSIEATLAAVKREAEREHGSGDRR